MKKDKKVLHLTLHKKWFDMILSGEKKEEYREYKDYWAKRFINSHGQTQGGVDIMVYEKWDIVRFANGYGKKARMMDVEFEYINVNLGKYEWGAPASDYVFIIHLGNVIQTYNIH